MTSECWDSPSAHFLPTVRSELADLMLSMMRDGLFFFSLVCSYQGRWLMQVNQLYYSVPVNTRMPLNSCRRFLFKYYSIFLFELRYWSYWRFWDYSLCSNSGTMPSLPLIKAPAIFAVVVGSSKAQTATPNSYINVPGGSFVTDKCSFPSILQMWRSYCSGVLMRISHDSGVVP
jgi:hypothetical protein